MAGEQLSFDIIARDLNASRTFNKVGDSADKAGKQMDGMGKDSSHLTKQLDETETHLKSLIEEFDKTGDVTLFKEIRKDKSTIRFLQSVKKELHEVQDEAQSVEETVPAALNSGIGDSLKSIPSEIKGPLIAAGVLVAAALAPQIGAAIGGAVLGGVGVGGIIGGIALAAQDQAVKQAAADVGHSLMLGLSGEADVFKAPLVTALHTVETASLDLTQTIGKGFRELAPLVVPLSEGVAGLVRNLGPGLAKALKAAEPAIRIIAQELPEIGTSISDALSSISDGSDGAVEGLDTLLHYIEEMITFTGDLVGFLSDTYDWLLRTGNAVTEWGEKWLGWIPIISSVVSGVHDETQSVIDDMTKAKSSTDTYVGSLNDVADGMTDIVRNSKEMRTKLGELATAIEDQFDPTANLIHRLQDVKKAQKDYNEAVKEHGPKSDAAKQAELDLAGAIVAANTAAANATGTFDGKFTPALRNILTQGGLTEAQIKDVETAFKNAQHAGENFAKDYRARIILDQQQTHREDARQYRASGGPVNTSTAYVVGEHGPEVVTFGASGYVHSNSSSRAMLSGASGGSAAPTEPTRIVFELVGGDEELRRWFKKSVRVYGGGDVQVAFGGN